MNKELVDVQEMMKQEENWEMKLAMLLDIEEAHLHALMTNQQEVSEKEQRQLEALNRKLQLHLSLGESLSDILFQEQLQCAMKRVHVSQRVAFLEALEYLALCFKDEKKKKD